MEFESILAYVASKCSFSYGFSGATGFLYESAKDELRWAGMRPKYYVRLIMHIGELVALDDEAFEKAKVRNIKMEPGDMAARLKAAFGG